MKRFVISGLSVLLAAAAIVPAVEAKTPDDSLVDTTVHQRRLVELYARTKSAAPLQVDDDNADYSFTQDINLRRDARDKR
ncbi:MAG: hypothetical protein AAGA46_06070 [Cyanobacteria bacterium P01_F01_bin.13]